MVPLSYFSSGGTSSGDTSINSFMSYYLDQEHEKVFDQAVMRVLTGRSVKAIPAEESRGFYGYTQQRVKGHVFTHVI